MKNNIISALGLIGFALLSSCGGGSNNSVTTVPTAHLAITLPAGPANAGTPYSFTVSALDSSNAVVKTYAGTVHITTSDKSATPPADATLTQGTGRFAVIFGTSNTSQTITASDIAGNAISGDSGTIDVTGQIGVNVSPETVALPPGDMQVFTANVFPFDTINREVTWSIKEGATGGSITAAGVYTAPATPGSYHVVAASVADVTVSVTAAVNVWSGGIATTPTGSMKNARGAYTATLLANGPALTNGKVLIAGGDSAPSPDTIVGISAAELYDSSTGIFASTGSMTAPRYAHTATLLLDGRVLVTGGLSDSGIIAGGSRLPASVLSSAELYDPATGQFAATGNMATPRANHTATLLHDGRVLIVGGLGQTVGGLFPYSSGDGLVTAELYDPTSGTFTVAGSMSTGRYAHTATLLGDGTVLVTGGITLADGGLFAWTATAELYDPQNGSFAPAGSMHAARAVHAATLLMGDTKVLITGGRFLSPATAEIYDSTTRTFVPTGNMMVSRFAHTATLTGNGEVLVAGGWLAGCTLFCRESVTKTLELYDPASGAFMPIGAMNAARSAHTATLLGSGAVLLAGGEGEVTAELYP